MEWIIYFVLWATYSSLLTTFYWFIFEDSGSDSEVIGKGFMLSQGVLVLGGLLWLLQWILGVVF